MYLRPKHRNKHENKGPNNFIFVYYTQIIISNHEIIFKQKDLIFWCQMLFYKSTSYQKIFLDLKKLTNFLDQDLLDILLSSAFLYYLKDMILALSPYYGYVFIAAACIAMECIIIGFIVPQRARKQIFTKQFMHQFEEVHRRQVDPNSKPSSQGYPDMGNGFYAQRLPYGQWYDLNNAQRAHYNFIQSIATTLTLLMIGGVYQPILAAAFGVGIFIGRIMYAIGYSLKGASGRLVGVIAIDICLLGLFVLSLMTGVKFVKGTPPYIR